MEKVLNTLTNPQKAIWLTDQFYESTSLSNLGGSLLIHQKVDFDLLNRAINLFIQKNEGMRLNFELKEGVPYQFVKDFSYKNFPIYFVTSKKQLSYLEDKFMHAKFNISKSFLYQFNLLKFKDGTGGFNIIVHHLIADAWSISLTVSEIIDIYSQLLKNEKVEEGLNPSYIEYIETEQKYLDSDKFKKDAQFWEDMFNSCPSCVSFSQKNPTHSSEKAKRKIYSLENSSEIADFCKNNNTSVFTFLMAIYSLYLNRISGVTDIVLGSPILNRNGIKEKKTIGLFVNTLPIKISVDGNVSFADLLKQVSDNQFSMFRHHKYPYSRLLEFLRMKYKFSNNLYDTIISYQNARNNSQTSDVNYSTNWDFNGFIPNSLEIHIYDMDNTGTLNIFYDYRLDRFNEDDIDDIHNRIMYIIKQVMDNVDCMVKDLEIVTEKEKNDLLYTYNDTALDYPKQKTIQELFEEQCNITPDKIAVAFGDSTLTYAELNKKANQLAYYLRNEKGIGPNDFVGLLTNRSLEMAVGLLAIIKAGAAYVPIDPEYPEDRVTYMMQDSNAKLVLVNSNTQNLYKLTNTLNIDFSGDIYKNYPGQNLDIVNSPSDLMYLIYTSGSTGKPKGVMLMHKNVNNFLHGLVDIIPFATHKVIVSVTTICFDIFVTEFWGGLLNGLTVVIANEQEQNITYDLNKLCLKYNVNIIQTTPSRFKLLLDNTDDLDFMNNITDLIVGGESLPKNLLHQFNSFNWVRVFNIYGPTETTVMSTIKDSPKEENITIGRPIANTQIYILDDNLHLLPPNIPGNLYIGGDGLGKGYHNRPELNKKVFITSPYDGKPLYDTKDLAYIQKDGDIVHIGRSDFQAKVHGFRIELGEIETSIMNYPGITNVVVLLQDGSLNAYVVSDSHLEEQSVINFLMKSLPHYMIPKTITRIDSIPLTPNGKINRKSSIFTPNNNISIVKVDPRNETERFLYKVIKDTLHIDIGVTNNIFEFGMDSLMIIKLVSKLYLYDIKLNIQDFYDNPSIEAIAKKISKNSKTPIGMKDVEANHITDISSIAKEISPIQLNDCKNILLTGVTGFLGVHVLESLILNTSCNIYCLIRAKNNKDPKARLIDRLKYYFDGKYADLIDKRIFIVDSTITNPYFGLSKETYFELGNNVSSVIHCAADTRHYGNYYIAEKINIQATDNIIRFCLDFNLILNHISTITVSGAGLVPVQFDGVFDENSFYVNQHYMENIYVKTKFMAEEEIYKSLDNGLVANIYRIGNLTNRFSDYKFQYNSYENGFLNKLRTIKNLKALPASLKDYNLEFTPVDSCANAIVKLSTENVLTHNINVFHLFNDQYIPMELITNIFKEDGIVLKYLNDKDFEAHVAKTLADSRNSNPGFVEQFKNNNFSFIDFNCSNFNTTKVLEKLHFSWPLITKEYLEYIIRRL